jgi:hypothetical protein
MFSIHCKFKNEKNRKKERKGRIEKGRREGGKQENFYVKKT